MLVILDAGNQVVVASSLDVFPDMSRASELVAKIKTQDEKAGQNERKNN